LLKFFKKYTAKMVGAGAGAEAEIFDKLQTWPKPHKNGPAPQHCLPYLIPGIIADVSDPDPRLIGARIVWEADFLKVKNSKNDVANLGKGSVSDREPDPD
jgi:hypothetical protein